MPQYPPGFEPIKKVYPEGFEPINKAVSKPIEDEIPDNMPEWQGPEREEPKSSFLDQASKLWHYAWDDIPAIKDIGNQLTDPNHQLLKPTGEGGIHDFLARRLAELSGAEAGVIGAMVPKSPLGLGAAALAGPITKGVLKGARMLPGAEIAERLLTKPLFGKAANVAEEAVAPISEVSPKVIASESVLPEAKVNPVEGGLTTANQVERMPGGPNASMYGIKDNTGMFPSVPSRMQAPSTNQTVFDALLPSRTKELIGQKVKLAEPELADIVTPEPLKAAESSPVPEIAQAAKQVIEARSKDKTFGTRIKQAAASMFKSGLSVLESDSPAGKAISSLVQQTRVEGEQLAGTWSSKFKKITGNLNKDEFENFVSTTEGKVAPSTPRVAQAVDAYRELDNEVSSTAEQAGMVMADYEGNVVPFKKVENYWPRIYPKGFVESKQKDIFEELIKSGHSPEEANTIIESSNKFGNRLISPQHARQADIGGYRTDKEAYLLHLDQMGKRIAESKNFGPQDLGDVASPLSQLVGETNNKGYVTEILERHLGRKRPGNESLDYIAGKANSLAAMTDLGLFTISNQAQKATIPIRGNLTAFAKALAQFKTAAGADFAEQSGALQTALRDSIQDLGGEHWVSRLYRTGASERSNRTLAAITGKFTAQSDFKALLKNPDNTNAAKRLSELLMLPPEALPELLQQGELNNKQLLTAGARMSEMTQGRAGSIDLPSEWRASPQMKLMTMYKGYAFRQTKAMKDAALANPVKFVTFGLPLLAMTGEAVGDVKAGIRGGLSSSKTAAGAVGERGKDNLIDKILKSANTDSKKRWLASRVAEDLSEAWMLGILGDMVGSAGENPTGLIKFIAGPVAGMASELGYGAVKSLEDVSPKPAAKAAIKTFIPSPVGYPASQADIFAKDKQKTGGRR